jgi:hypothetical protein
VAVREQAMTGGIAITRYLHVDAAGTPVAETLPDRTLLRRSEYEPFGKLLNRPETDGVGFRGEVMDRGTGLRYAPKGHVHPMLPGFFGACGWQDQAGIPDIDATHLLQGPPRPRC